MSDMIHEPLKEYAAYKDLFEKTTAERFEKYLEESGVDEEENRKTVAEYDRLHSESGDFNKKARRTKMWRTLCIIITVIGLIYAVVCILNMAGVTSAGGATLMDIIGLVVSLLLATSMLLVIFLKLNKVIENLLNEANKRSELAALELAKAREQMEPLNNLFTWNIANELVNEVMPVVKLDNYFDIKKSNYMSQYFGLKENPEANTSILEILSGDINKNPFIVQRTIEHEMGSKIYTGELLVTWTEYYYDSEGRRHESRKSEILRASVSKPYPEYNKYTYTYYCHESCPDLSFSRVPQVSAGASESKLERQIKRGEQKLNKQAQKALKKGENFTVSNNTEFEVLFGAINRNNEVQFRMMFTPVAQRNMTALIKNKEPYGDDFYFTKFGELNEIASYHGQEWDFNTTPSQFTSHDVKESRKVFNDFNNDFFKNMYFELAPLLSIPIYQDEPSRSYDEIEADSNFAIKQASAVVNAFSSNVFEPEGSATNSILDVIKIGKYGECDVVKVVANAYAAYERVDYVTMYCKDGNYYNVAVPWYEYLPISRESLVAVVDGNADCANLIGGEGCESAVDYALKYANNGLAAMRDGVIGFILNEEMINILTNHNK